MQFEDSFGDGESESCAAFRVAGAIETIEDMRQMFFADAATGIDDAHRESIVLRRE